MTASSPPGTPGFLLLVAIDAAGAHPAAWAEGRPGGHRADEQGTSGAVAALVRAVRAAERAGFTAATFTDQLLPKDAPGVLDAVLRAAHVAPLTGAIGLIPAVQALYAEPFHLATQVASLDTASHGRAGWIVSADPDPRLAALYGRPALPAAEADGELADIVAAARRLWDTWEDDAVIRESATGRYYDRTKVHYADFVGTRFLVKGPAIVPRSPQGQPVVFGPAGTSAEVDAVLVDAPAAPGEPIVAAAAEPLARARANHGAGVRVILDVEVVLDAAGVRAADRLAALDRRAGWAAKTARYVGDAAGLEALLGQLASIADGVRIAPAQTDVDLEEIGRAVLPPLRQAGIVTSPRAGDTLRDSLGLGRPESRYLEVAR
ncbi:MAG TPA: LLM class flavin-dependent oxidoreductase [Microbacteriaceae bacterium]|nr:LLM class flavin-dependent oxidoreductase [Microbacteriaceae bacterium]